MSDEVLMPKTERDRQVMEWMTGHLSPFSLLVLRYFFRSFEEKKELCTNSKIYGLTLKFDKVLGSLSKTTYSGFFFVNGVPLCIGI